MLLLRQVLLVIVSSTFCQLSFGQDNPAGAQLESAMQLFSEGKTDAADSITEEIVKNAPGNGEAWDLLVKIRYKEYDDLAHNSSAELPFGVTITTKDEKGNDISASNVPGADSLAQQLTQLLRTLSPSKIAYSKYIYTLRKATLLSEDAYAASFYLRRIYVDVDIDSNVSDKARAYFNDAEKEFVNKNYDKAAGLYKKACTEQPDFYKAHMYLGDCYYATRNYTDAVIAFKSAKEQFPFLLEPRKYLTDAYAKLGLYDKCLDEAINTMTIYPDKSMVRKIKDAARLNDKQLAIKWTPRGILPNRKVKKTSDNINNYSDPSDSVVNGPWKIYKEAGRKIMPYCNQPGIVTERNDLTRSRYMEVYSWEEMLKNSQDPVLDEARKMQRLGFLDCYVLVTCYHIDFYGQYKDFVNKNSDHVAEYYRTFITKK